MTHDTLWRANLPTNVSGWPVLLKRRRQIRDLTAADADGDSVIETERELFDHRIGDRHHGVILLAEFHGDTAIAALALQAVSAQVFNVVAVGSARRIAGGVSQE